jgi:cytochrome d ubiquinol oxidase subunit I
VLKPPLADTPNRLRPAATIPSMSLNTIILSRLQFAFTIGCHILWPAYSIGIAGFIVLLNALWLRTGRTVYRDLMRFWVWLFALGFAMGVVTGVVLSYEIGANWSGFARLTGNVLGPLFMYETLTAFFLEACFVGIVLYGESRVGPWLHFSSCLLLSIGTVLSAFWVLAANSWMQTPQGATLGRDHVFHADNWMKVIFNPSFPYRFAHMVCASYVTCIFVVAGVSAIFLIRRRDREFAETGLSLAMWIGLLLVPLQMFLGDMHGQNTRRYQPIKLAAIEARWDTGRGIPLTLFAWPEQEAATNIWAVDIPHLGSLILAHSWNGEVLGLKEVPPQNRPYVPIVFFAFRAMVGIGLVLLSLVIVAGYLRWRGRLFSARWFHIMLIAASPLGFLAILAGWVVTEAGRQPWVVYNMMRTGDAASPLAAPKVGLTLSLFVIVYAFMMLFFLWFFWRIILRGPHPSDAPATAERSANRRMQSTPVVVTKATK